MAALKLSVFALGVIAFFSWFANSIPQIESHPPKRIALDTPLSPEEMVAAGEGVFNGKGACNICHAIGRPGNRGPDLADIGLRAGSRQRGKGPRDYLLESLLQPTAYLIEGYGALMPPMAAILSPGELLVTVAYLQSLGGEVDVKPQHVRAALARAGTAEALPTVASAPATAPAAMDQGDAGRGKEIYLANCAPCHGPDPAQDGPVGPRIRGANPDLVAARVLRAAYPPGHTPLRDTKLMPPMPQLEREVPHLAAFLARE
ncbi:MAG: c-type cytochrome [Candidatus Lambdaproteobacteria bacterium]|nr:c-type cytochrome [Candidatus Lambdaproteobacteria bacterium]